MKKANKTVLFTTVIFIFVMSALWADTYRIRLGSGCIKSGEKQADGEIAWERKYIVPDHQGGTRLVICGEDVEEKRD